MTRRLSQLLSEGHTVDAHLVAQTLITLCPDSRLAGQWLLTDAMALYRLEERPRSRALLAALASHDDPALRRLASTLLGWTLVRDGQPWALTTVLNRMDPEAQARLLTLAAVGDRSRFRQQAQALNPRLREKAQAAHDRYLTLPRRSTWLAGGLSAAVPGLGQAYAGSWEAAAVAFTLNAVLITATVELADHELYFGAGTCGLAASMFYVGNILSAVDLVRRRNQAVAHVPRGELEHILLPELGL